LLNPAVLWPDRGAFASNPATAATPSPRGPVQQPTGDFQALVW